MKKEAKVEVVEKTGEKEEVVKEEKYDARKNGPARKGRLSNHRKEARFRRVVNMLEKGLTVEQIAEKLQLKNARSVYRITKRAYFQEKFNKDSEKVVEKARKIFESNAVEAATKIVRLSRSGENRHKLQLEASKEVLYQVGMKPVEVLETRQRTYTPEEVQSSLETLKEAEKVVDRLSTTESPYLLPQKEEVPACAPVPITQAEEIGEGDIKQTGNTG